MKVHMHHFLMRHGSIVLQNVVRGCAGGFQNCSRNQWQRRAQSRRACW